MKASLEKEGFYVTIETDGIRGEDEALSDVYNLVILDVMLPNKSGFEILRTIKFELDKLSFSGVNTDDGYRFENCRNSFERTPATQFVPCT